MPAPGDQHTSLANPFDLAPQRISEWTAEEAATLQTRLEKQLGPEYLSTRPGPSGQRLTYIGAEKIIALANEVFGFNGWSSSIRDVKIDYYEEEKPSGKICIGVSVIVRVTLRDGTYHEDIGFGHVENNRSRFQCYEKAKKEGTTDALKRALRQFGNLLGLCVYDKAYVSKVAKVKAVPVKFDENALHRHPDFVVKNEPSGMIKQEKTDLPAQQPPSLRPPQLPNLDSFEDFLGELDEADFSISDEGQPDEIILPNSTESDSTLGNVSNNSHDQAGRAGVHNQAGNIGNHGGSAGSNAMHPPVRQLARATSAGNNPPRQMPQTPVQQAPRPNINQFPGAGAQNRGPPMNGRPQQSNQNRPAPQPTHAKQNGVQNQNPQFHMTTPQTGNNDNSTTGARPGDESLGFFSARAVKSLPEDVLQTGKLNLKPEQAFNPHFESSSIPRTPGVDHSASKPLSKSLQHVPARKTEETETLLGTSGAVPRAAVGGGSGVGNAAANARSALGAGLAAAPKPANVINPQLDQTRRIGAPVSSSPLGNRGQFRPLTVKRPAAGVDGPNGAGGGATNGNGVAAAAAAAGRVPLADVSSNVPVGPGINGAAEKVGTGPEAKRQRVS